MQFTIELNADQAEEDSASIVDGLHRFNLQYAEPEQYVPLKVFARNEMGVLVGGLLGETFWNWLHVDDLWVHESYRQAGVGKQLMARAEAEAIQRGCLHAYLDTLDFQAPDFYHKLGYTIWGVLDDFPPGHQRIFLKKDL